jgi:hypothetical protein
MLVLLTSFRRRDTYINPDLKLSLLWETYITETQEVSSWRDRESWPSSQKCRDSPSWGRCKGSVPYTLIQIEFY